MTPKLRIRRRRSSSRHGESGTPNYPGGLVTLITTFLLAVILITGPGLILGAARLWIELPLMGAVTLLLVVQGLRLTARPPAGALRRADAIDLAAALFVLYGIVRWLTSPTEYFSRIEAMDVVAYAGVFFTCRYGMANRRCCMALLLLLVGLGAGETIFGYYPQPSGLAPVRPDGTAATSLCAALGGHIRIPEPLREPSGDGDWGGPGRGKLVQTPVAPAHHFDLPGDHDDARGDVLRITGKLDRAPGRDLRAGDYGHSQRNDAVVGAGHGGAGVGRRLGIFVQPGRRLFGSGWPTPKT